MRFAHFAVALVAVVVTAASVAHAEPATKVYINGRATPVYFNDGDSFKPLAGPFKGSQSRLAGFNTLESFGPVHAWGTWTEKEMWVIAKLATKHAQHGVWHCETDAKRDTYGRLLMHCKDLAKSHIENGFAQVMTIDEKPGDPELIEAQQRAIAGRRGMWAHGVPSYILSSLHSTSEGGDKNGKTSNRLVSTTDGHSEKWAHETDYPECEKVCRKSKVLTDAALPIVKEAIVAIDGLKDASDVDVVRYTDEFLSFGSATSGREHRAALDGVFKRLQGEGKLTAVEQNDSCHVYVDFRRRFGGDRAMCLR
ncbi:MAG TPA: thermonuclease family protein [Myxococcota bacterium]